MDSNTNQKKGITQEDQETIKKNEKLIILPLPKEPYYQPHPTVRRYNNCHMNPFDNPVTLKPVENQMDPDMQKLMDEAIASILPPTPKRQSIIIEPNPLKAKAIKNRRNTVIATKRKSSKEKTISNRRNTVTTDIPKHNTAIQNIPTPNLDIQTKLPSEQYHMPDLGDVFPNDQFLYLGIPRTPRADDSRYEIMPINGTSENTQTHHFKNHEYSPLFSRHQIIKRKVYKPDLIAIDELMMTNMEEINQEMKEQEEITQKTLQKLTEIMIIATQAVQTE